MFGRVRIRGVRPIDIGRRLVAAMDEVARSNANAVPAAWRIRMNPDDLEELAAIREALVHELTTTIANHAAFEGYLLRGPAMVDLRPDPTVTTRECQLEPAPLSAAIAANASPPETHDESEHLTEGAVMPTVTAEPAPMEIAAPTERPRAAAKTGAWSLVAADGTRFLLEGDVATIGRQAGSSIHIPDNNVSRLHAELRRVSGSWTIEDRGSTNGTRINGTMTVDPTPLVDGDLIALGAVELRVERG
jgi:hypothetical protein